MGSSQKSSSRSLLPVPAARWAYPVLFLIAFLLRLPFFFRDYIDRDESTFILMGQAWVDGYLPYTELWDNKTPLTFLFFAAVIYLFGKSFIAIRLAGTLVVALIGWATFDLTRRAADTGSGWAAGTASILLCSLFGSIQGVMSEHLLMAAYMLALTFLLGKDRFFNRLAAGLLLGTALMIKVSIAFPVLLLGLWLLYDAFRHFRPGPAIRRIISIALPALAVILATLVPYMASGQAAVWWNSVVLAPLGYTRQSGVSPTAAWGISLGVLSLLVWGIRSGRLSLRHPVVPPLFLTVLGILWSFIQSGRVNSHYLVQVYPPLLVLLAIAFAARLTPFVRRYSRAVLILLLLLPAESYLEYGRVANHWKTQGSPFNGEGFSVPAYLEKSGLQTEDILFLHFHIGYWILDRYPPSKAATHPSNLCRDEMFPYYNGNRLTTLQELRYLMEEVRPPLVVRRHGRRAFDKEHKEENAYMDSIMSVRYSLRDTVEMAAIYSRVKP